MSKKINIKPRGSWVLVKPKELQRETTTGLIIPDSVEKEQKAQGEIIDVGPKVTDLKPGQQVVYGKYSGEEIQLATKEEQKDQVDFVLIPEFDILAVLE